MENIKKFTTRQLVGLILGPVLFAAVLLAPLQGLSYEGKAVLAVLLFVVTYWVTEPITVGAASLIPIVLLPLLGAVSGDVAAKAYADPMNFLFLGGFAIALALEKWRLHERIALTIIGFFGGSISGIIIGILFASFFISMWVSNTATAMMLLPIGTAVSSKIINLMKEENVYSKEDEKSFTSAVILSVSLGAIIGGSATLIGTPPNVILAGMVEKTFGYEIPFGQWMIFAVPMCILILAFAAFYVTKVGFPIKVKKLKGGKEFILEEKRKLGKMGHEEKIVFVIFIVTVFFWLSRTFLWTGVIPGISDTMIAITAAILLYTIPAKKGGRLLGADSFAKMPWGILLMIGGGMSIAAGFSSTDLATWLGNQLLALSGYPYFIILGASGALAIAVTQVAPNTATTTIMLPIAASLAQAVGVNPLPVMTITALGAGFAFMLPIGTPNLGIVYASGKVSMDDMIKTGFWLTVASFIIIFIFTYLLFPVVMGINPLASL